MPNPEHGCQGLVEPFLKHIYNVGMSEKKRWALLAALSGAHSIGRAKPENSGYDGWWGDPENQGIFNSDYFRNIAAKGWGPQRAVGGNPEKNQWKIIDKSSAKDKGEQMMLDTDMCLLYNDNRNHAACMKKVFNGKLANREACKKFDGVGDQQLHARSSTCCAWMQHKRLDEAGIIGDHETYCGVD